MQKVLQAVAGDTQKESSWWRAATLEGLADGVLRRKPDPASLKSLQDPLFRLFENPAAPIRRAALSLLQASNVGEGAAYQRALQRSLTAAADRSVDSEQRADAIAFLALVRPGDQVELLKRLVDVQEPAPVQMAATRALGKIPGEAVGTFLISKWRVLTRSGAQSSCRGHASGPGPLSTDSQSAAARGSPSLDVELFTEEKAADEPGSQDP